ncbi:hypothetical protein CEXT_635521 [Caerostris extrusa]|uniref:Uncharacterized protein n=1 Tax=Caerostris extrusa TaxID=172846 RepID=A0AAV4XM77_CAEEX|nr:hypothetical protein CEXT_635521 [Caerostris extrusa]
MVTIETSKNAILRSRIAREPLGTHNDPSDNDHWWKMPNSLTICCKVAQSGVASFSSNVPPGVTKGRDSVRWKGANCV